MKKIAMFIAAAAIAVSASAQKTAVTASKPADNLYVGVAFGAQTKAMCSHEGAFRAFNPTATVIVGKNFTPIFGLRAEGQVMGNVHSTNPEKCQWFNASKTFVNTLNVNLLSTWNINNIVAGYKGEPRAFEYTALFGFGWQHGFNHNEYLDHVNNLVSKAGLQIAYNFGKNKEFQAFVEPSITYVMANHSTFVEPGSQGDNWEISEFCPKYNLKNAVLDLKAGLIYKLPCSNGTNNFAIEQLRDQAEIDALNAQINAAKAEAAAIAAAKDAEIANLKKLLADCENKPVPVIEKKAANLQPSVVFGLAKSNVEQSQMANVQMIANYMKANKDAKVKISGYASPEGNAELNQKLSEARANAVKDVLVKKYKIAADRLETEGLGATDKLFDEIEFNRVALFNDLTK